MSDRIGKAGEFPYTRGIHATMYQDKPWTMRQYAGFGNAAQTNARFRALLAAGQTGLSTAFDLPTQMGYDSDHPMARGEVGKVGVAIDTVEDIDVLFSEIPLDRVSTSMTINATASTLLAMYVAVGRSRGIASGQLRGTIQNDVLKEYIARGTYIYPPRASMRIITDIFAWCGKEAPRFNTISISGYHIREAGSTAAQEIAFTLADGIAYVDAAVAAGLAVDDFAPRLSFFFNAHNDLLEEVGKFRAARRLWSTLMRDRFGAKDPRSHVMRFHTQTAGSTLAAKQVDNNVVRVTLQALAAVLGGTQSLHTNGRDEALALPSQASATLALRTQQVIACESGVTAHVDPLGGSYVVEAITDRLEAEARQLIGEIDALGGMVAAIERGFPQREIQDAAYRAQVRVDRGEQKVVGVNAYTDDAPLPSPEARLDPATEALQVARLREVRARRDAAAARSGLDAVQQAAAGRDNVMGPILAAVEARATLGEIADALRAVFGEYQESVVV
jgi:methylmalonyl-CoA mutase N-terminal domain/subunit